MQVSELEALDTGSRIRINLDDRGHQTWVKTEDGFTNGTLTAYAHTFTAPLAADRVEVITVADLAYDDLPKYRFNQDWVDAPDRSAWALRLRDRVFSGIPHDMRINTGRYGEGYICIIDREEAAGAPFTVALPEHIQSYGLPSALEGMRFRFFTRVAVERLSDREALLCSLPTIRFLRDETIRIHGDYMRSWFGEEEIVELRATPVTNAGSYVHFMLAPEGVTEGGFIVEASHCSDYGIPESLVGMRGQWARQSQVAPSEEEVAEREAARARQAEWFDSQPKYRVQPGRFSINFDRAGLTVMHLPNVGTSRAEDWIGLPQPESGETYGLWEVTLQRQQEFNLPLETIGMLGYWINQRYLTLVDPVTEWLDSLPKRRYLPEGGDPPSGNYMDTRPPVAYVETDQSGTPGGLFFGGANTNGSLDWGFWNDSEMLRYIPEHLHSHLGQDLFGYWVDPDFTERVLTPDEVEAEVQQRIDAAVEAATARLQRQARSDEAAVERMNSHVIRLSEALRTMLDEHDYDYGCSQDDTLEEVGYPRERPTENIWVEVKVTGESYYTVDDSTIEAHFDHNIATESGSYDVSFSWEREERVEDVSVESDHCVCGDDPDDVLNLDDLRRRLRDMTLPGSSGDWEFEIVNCENG